MPMPHTAAPLRLAATAALARRAYRERIGHNPRPRSTSRARSSPLRAAHPAKRSTTPSSRRMRAQRRNNRQRVITDQRQSASSCATLVSESGAAGRRSCPGPTLTSSPTSPMKPSNFRRRRQVSKREHSLSTCVRTGLTRLAAPLRRVSTLDFRSSMLSRRDGSHASSPQAHPAPGTS